MDRITAKQFFKSWMKIVSKRQDELLRLWHIPKEYTNYIKGSDNSVISEIALDLDLHSYEKDYYSLDTIFYKVEDLTPGISPNTYWFHDIRIGFEHENNFGSGLYQEVSHLLLINCELKVLVTYPNVDSKDELDYLHSIISTNRQSKNISEKENFLIIFGYKTDFEWEGFVYKSESWKQIF